jgi:hypothetical protein
VNQGFIDTFIDEEGDTTFKVNYRSFPAYKRDWGSDEVYK